jgi:hypothetical protein
VANNILQNYDKLPANVQNLIFRFADNKKIARYVAKAVSNNYDKLPQDVAIQLLEKLS